jgi:hypothetical protein
MYPSRSGMMLPFQSSTRGAPPYPLIRSGSVLIFAAMKCAVSTTSSRRPRSEEVLADYGVEPGAQRG